MVKMKASCLLCAILLLAACSPIRREEPARPEVLALAKGRLGRPVSLALSGDRLLAVFSDWETTSLYLVEVPLGPHLPADSPRPAMIDKIDATPPLSPTFGAHALLVRNDSVSVLYQVREGGEKFVLKLVTKPLKADQWTLDVVEPPGDPIALLPGDGGKLDIFWAAGSLLARARAGALEPLSVCSPFAPEGRASFFESDPHVDEAPAGTGRIAQARAREIAQARARGFTVYDAYSKALLAFRWSGGGFEQRDITDGNPIHSSLLTREGLLAVLTWDPRAHRLFLLEEEPRSGEFRRTTVTLCDGTVTVVLLPADASPGSSRMGFRFLFDEARRLGGGKVKYYLSLLTADASRGIAARRYRKTVLLSGDEPIESFAAAEASDALYILALQGSLKLLRIGLAAK